MAFKRALILTVGTGTRADVDIAKPLLKTARDSNPNYLVLVTTDAGKKHAARIAKELRLAPGEFEVVILEHPDDFQRIFREINTVFRNLEARDFARDEIQLDFTSGTKAMSAGAVCSAIFKQCSSIKYITGERDRGVVKNGTERFLTIIPSEIHALHDYRLALHMMRRLQFSAAGDILRDVSHRGLAEEDALEVDSARQIAAGYQSWELFNHSVALTKLQKFGGDNATIAEFTPTRKAFELLERLSVSAKERPKDLLLVDLFNNALRRAHEGKYDDAVARLYRSAELCAQAILAEPPFGIDTSNVDPGKAPSSIRSSLETGRANDGSIKIGMAKAYELLHAFGHPSGKEFKANRKLQSLLGKRNASILAHGTDPIPKSVFDKLRDHVIDLISLHIEDFRDKSAETQYPWLKSDS